MRFFSFFLLLFLSCQAVTGQDKPLSMQQQETAVRAVITEFLTAGDVQDSKRIAAVLNPEYRVVINQFMGSPGVTVIDRAAYLGMIDAKKLGGTPREVQFQSVEIVGNLAFVRAQLSSDKLSFDTLFALAKAGEKEWTLVSDLPYVTPKS